LCMPMLASAAECAGSWTDHARFPLTGAHSQGKCTCASCHIGSFQTGSAGGGATCLSCHGGSRPAAMQKNTGHIPTTQDCSVCHSSLTTFANASMNHVGIINGCEQCHRKPSNHPSVTNPDCSVCHDTKSGGWLCHAG
jgi:hypothetical protein